MIERELCKKCRSDMVHIPKEPWWVCALCAGDMVLQVDNLRSQYNRLSGDSGLQIEQLKCEVQEKDRLNDELKTAVKVLTSVFMRDGDQMILRVGYENYLKCRSLVAEDQQTENRKCEHRAAKETGDCPTCGERFGIGQ